MNPDKSECDESELPLCVVCENVIGLVDLRPGFDQAGIYYSEEDLPYKMVCCDRQLRISNDEKRKRAIMALKKYHGMA